MPEQLYAEIPQDLRDADELLTKYGRWSVRHGGKRTCGSAEGQYAIPPSDDNREPREIQMPPLDAMKVQRALSRVPERERLVLAVIYIPSHIHPAKRLRAINVFPRDAQEMHRRGLRMFDNIYARLDKRSAAMAG